MALVDKNTLKGWFQNGDYPNQDQFWTWMDSYFHKDESVPIEKVNGLSSILTGKATNQDIENVNQRIDELEGQIGTGPLEIVYDIDGEFVIPSGKLLDKIVVIPSGDIVLSIGNENGTSDIMVGQVLLASKAVVIGVDLYAIIPKTIYLSGITSNVAIKFYIR